MPAHKPSLRLICAIAIILGFAFAQPAFAREHNDVAGRFDYWVLALSWSPTYCADSENADQAQCDEARDYAFVVHGLWPQYERGWPERCETSEPSDTPWRLRRSMLDIMPSPALVEHQWDKHGVCSGLSQKAYFDRVRQIKNSIVVPKPYVAPERAVLVTAAQLEAAFARANPGLTGAMIAVQCADGRLREVRICLSREGRFRACGADVRDRCGSRAVTMPPVR
jgi:ribonuclease T2